MRCLFEGLQVVFDAFFLCIRFLLSLGDPFLFLAEKKIHTNSDTNSGLREFRQLLVLQ